MSLIGKALFGLVVLALVLNASSADHSCPDNFFDCKNKRCIAHFFVCDDDNDCGNFEDEMNCFVNDTTSNTNNSSTSSNSTSPIKYSCPDGHFACNDEFHSCIPQRWYCDGIRECMNGADEADCREHKIDCGQDFQCASGDECVPVAWKCDGFHDCSDNSDELNCSHIMSVDINCDQEHGKYQCTSGECIDYSKRCDGNRDCILGDDEGIQCHLHSCNDKRCSHICVENPATNSTQCLCPSGFQLKNGTTCVDFDECSDNKMTNMCSQQCVNLEGSHRCACDAGYKLVNQTKCVVESGPAVIFYSFDDQIRSFELKDNRVSESFLGSPGELITELDIDIARRKLYFVGVKHGSHGTIYEAEFDGDFRLGRPKAIMIHDKLTGVEGIAVDYVTGNIYLTDSTRNAISVCRSEPNVCLTVIRNRQKPRAILVIPQRGQLFWTEWGSELPSQNGIYQSNMDGSNVTLLIGNLSWPNGLSFDENRNRIYWTDGHHGSIEYYDFDLELRHHVYEDPQRQPYAIHAFEDQIYWSDWSRDALIVQDKITGHNLRPLIFNTASNLLGLAVYHQLLQKSSHNPCSLEPCSHMCLIKTPTEFSCACPDHMRLAGKFRCEVNDDEPYILATTGRKLFKFYTNEIHSSSSEEVPLPAQVIVGSMTFDYSNQKLYIFDSRSGSIGRIDQLRGRLRFEKLVVEDIDLVVSLHHEINSNSLYWIDYILNTVEVFSLDNRHRLTLFNKIAKPISLALDSANRLMYIGSRAHPAKIYSSYLDGTSLRKIIETRMNGIPIAMVKRTNSLIWADPTFGKIEEILAFGTTVAGRPRKLNPRPVGNVHSLDYVNRTLFWTNADSAKVFYSSMMSSALYFGSSPYRQIFSRDIPDSGSFNTEDIRLIVVHKEKATLSDCQNHSCAHLCLIGSKGRSCRCENGFYSNDNGSTCVEDSSTKIIHIPHANQTQTFHWILKSFEEIFSQPNTNDTDDDDYMSLNSSAEESNPVPLSVPPPKVTVIKVVSPNYKPIDNPKIPTAHRMQDSNKIGPKHSPWKLFLYFFLIISLVAVIAYYQFPSFRDTVINIRIGRSPLDRNTSTTRFFRNPNYGFNPANNDRIIDHQTEPKTLEDANSNLL